MLTSHNFIPASGVWNSYEIGSGAWTFECQYFAICQTLIISIKLKPASGVWNSYEIAFGACTLECQYYAIRGAITKKNGKIWEKFPKGGGGKKKQTKIPNFNLGIWKT